jgi:hypothetical protein
MNMVFLSLPNITTILASISSPAMSNLTLPRLPRLQTSPARGPRARIAQFEAYTIPEKPHSFRKSRRFIGYSEKQPPGVAWIWVYAVAGELSLRIGIHFSVEDFDGFRGSETADAFVLRVQNDALAGSSVDDSLFTPAANCSHRRLRIKISDRFLQQYQLPCCHVALEFCGYLMFLWNKCTYLNLSPQVWFLAKFSYPKHPT